jgi:hypothetical protein
MPLACEIGGKHKFRKAALHSERSPLRPQPPFLAAGRTGKRDAPCHVGVVGKGSQSRHADMFGLSHRQTSSSIDWKIGSRPFQR